MIADESGFIGAVIHAQDHARAVETANRRLIVQIKGADGFQLVIEKLQS